jgi:hypothetical protein
MIEYKPTVLISNIALTCMKRMVRPNMELQYSNGLIEIFKRLLLRTLLEERFNQHPQWFYRFGMQRWNQL